MQIYEFGFNIHLYITSMIPHSNMSESVYMNWSHPIANYQPKQNCAYNGLFPQMWQLPAPMFTYHQLDLQRNDFNKIGIKTHFLCGKWAWKYRLQMSAFRASLCQSIFIWLCNLIHLWFVLCFPIKFVLWMHTRIWVLVSSRFSWSLMQ